MRNKIDDLRDHLFEVIEALKDHDHPMDIERAKAVADVAQTLINSAKVEVDMLRQVGGVSGSTFFQRKPDALDDDAPKLRAIDGPVHQ